MDDFNVDDLENEELITIDIEALNSDSKKEAESVIEIVTSLYQDEDFKKRHPQARKRIELEIETLRGLIKMRKADEEAHDALLIAITENKSNASLYRSMAEIQKTSIALSNKIHDTIDRLNQICKGFQLELPFNEPDEEVPKETGGAHRGTKSFIEEMINKTEN